MTITISPIASPTPEFAALVDAHVAFCDTTAPAESCHRLPVEALFSDDVTIWTAADAEGALVAMGALKALSPTSGEIKSMHTTDRARGQGIARRMLETILTEARRRGYGSLWLETGTHEAFTASRALYTGLGFTECEPFGGYTPDPHSIFMTRDLSEQELT